MIGNFDVVGYLLGLLVLFLSVSVHEYAHAKAAYDMGDKTAYYAGRMTLNPIKHFEPLGLILILLRAPVAWGKPVPVNPRNIDDDRDYKKATLWIALAGITSNLILAVIAVALYYLLGIVLLAFKPVGTAVTIINTIQSLCFSLMFTNINLAVFNILPVPPLDGFELWGRLLPAKWTQWMNRNARYIGLVFFLIIVFFNRPFGRFLRLIINPLVKVINFPFRKIFELIAQALI